MTRAKHLSVLAALSAIFIASCGNSNNTEQASSVPETETNVPTEEITGGSENGDTIDIILNSADNMKFDKSEIKVSEGKTIRLTLNHTGSMAKSTMGHNFVLLKQGIDLREFANNATQQGTAPDFEVPQALLNDVIAHTKMIGGGESVTTEFPAPEKGTYDFICSFPGHVMMMKGKFIVQ